MKRTAPWFLTWVLLAGLGAVFMGERVVEAVGPVRAALSGLGAATILACIAWRYVSWRAATDEAKSVERLLLVAYAGCILTLALYFISSDDGMRWLGIDFVEDAAADRYDVVFGVLWPIVLAVSLLPALAAQFTLGAHRHARAAGPGLESLRVADVATTGLSVALAAALLFVVGWTAAERDATLDLSYFQTASAGTATAGMVEGLDAPLRVLLFFPEVNPVKDEVLGYFRALDRATGGVEIETHDRFAAPALAEEHRVGTDGTVILASGDGAERIVLGTELTDARPELRTLDAEVQRRLMTLLRSRRTVYLTTGHGELNDTVSAGPMAAAGLGGTRALEQLLGLLNYNVRELGLAQGLGQDVPDDAAAVMVLGPRRPFLPAELSAIDRYLAEGGSLLLALEPEGDFELGPLEARLGVRFVGQPLADEERHVRRRGNASDRGLIITDRFTSHAAATTASRARMGSAVLFVGAGHLMPAPAASGAPGEGVAPGASASAAVSAGASAVASAGPSAGAEPLPGWSTPDPRFIVRSLPTTFADLDRDFAFDEAREERQSYNLVAAVEVEVLGEPANVADATLVKASSDDASAEAGPAAADAAASPETDPAAAADAAESEEQPQAQAQAQADTGQGPEHMRALVYADAGAFSDAVLTTLGLNAALLADGVKWLGGEEAFAGVAQSEEDIPIVHTRAEDVAWFYSTILGAPALVLALGLAGVYRRRRRRGEVLS